VPPLAVADIVNPTPAVAGLFDDEVVTCSAGLTFTAITLVAVVLFASFTTTVSVKLPVAAVWNENDCAVLEARPDHAYEYGAFPPAAVTENAIFCPKGAGFGVAELVTVSGGLPLPTGTLNVT